MYFINEDESLIYTSREGWRITKKKIEAQRQKKGGGQLTPPEASVSITSASRDCFFSALGSC